MESSDEELKALLVRCIALLELLVGAGSRETRIPLQESREALYDFLLRNGPSSRKQIISAGFPAGSLSDLLNSKRFRRVRHGVWWVSGLPLPRAV